VTGALVGEELVLPRSDGSLAPYRLGEPTAYEPDSAPLQSRVFYAAAHIVCDPVVAWGPGGPTHVDWEATLAYRHHLWSYGLGVAEAMDTAQRGSGLDWATARELIRRSAAEAKAVGGRIACGAGTDQLDAGRSCSLEEVLGAYLEQVAFVEGQGAAAIVMASRALAGAAAGPDDYRRVYDAVLSQASRPVIIHWLGPMFDPALAGYWGSDDLNEATALVLDLVADHSDRIEGIKISLLDAEREAAMRRLLPEGVRMYTGDDLNYPSLIRGDDQSASDALLGIFDPIAPAAAAALRALDAGAQQRFDEILAPTLPLARHVFQSPTYNYKVGIVFLAYLNGHQGHFRLLGGLESGRSVVHLAELLVLADRCGLLRDPELAADRMRRVLAVAGVGVR